MKNTAVCLLWVSALFAVAQAYIAAPLLTPRSRSVCLHCGTPTTSLVLVPSWLPWLTSLCLCVVSPQGRFHRDDVRCG